MMEHSRALAIKRGRRGSEGSGASMRLHNGRKQWTAAMEEEEGADEWGPAVSERKGERETAVRAGPSWAKGKKNGCGPREKEEGRKLWAGLERWDE